MENQTPINRIGLVPAQNRGHQIISVIRELFKPIIEVMEKESVYSISFVGQGRDLRFWLFA